MSSDKQVVLPASDEITRRLISVRPGVGHYHEFLFPRIAEHGGQSKNALMIAMLVSISFESYIERAEDFPFDKDLVIATDAPEFIDAIVDDADVAKTAKLFISELHAAA